MQKEKQVFVRRCLIFLVLLMPFIYMCYQIFALQLGENDTLGPEPGKAITWFMGEWAFNVLILTLAVTPVRKWFGWGWILIHRRMLGLFVMFYATLHLLAYMAFLLGWEWSDIGIELIERPYLTLGFIAWLLLVPLAVTSTKAWQRRLKKKWKTIHKLIYVIAILCSIHYLLQIRSSWFEPSIYALIVIILLSQRLSFRRKNGL